MRPLILLALLTTTVATSALAVQTDVRIFAAPFGRVVREAEPDLNVFYVSDRLRSHSVPLANVEHRGLGSSCERAFFQALEFLADKARAAGANGLTGLHSPGATPQGAPIYACTPHERGFEVHLVGVAARLTGSDAPPPPKPERPVSGASSRTASSLRFVYTAQTIKLQLPAAALARDDIQFFRPTSTSGPPRTRISDVTATGYSRASCTEAFNDALTNLGRSAFAYQARLLVAVRSAELEAEDASTHYVCQQDITGRLTVRLVGTAAEAAPAT